MAADALQIASPVREERLSLSTLNPRPRVELGGALIDQIDLSGALEHISGFLSSDSPHHVMTVNLDFLSIARRDPLFRETINRVDLAVADGMPLIWLSQLKGRALPERVTGVDLVDQSCKIASESGHSVFLLGAREGIAEAAGSHLRSRYPDLQIAGVYSPPFGPFTDDENKRMVEMVRRAAPSLLFVAFGAPRQDLWIADHLDDLQVPVAMGVGCVLDLLAGVVRRAPAWVQQAGLEWLYRLVHEPRRLWRRYVIDDMPMLVQLLLPVPRATAAAVPISTTHRKLSV
jgi:N-acetylglucosaminyldiphosphoundecaprenol N-acetyl-beta-D-mannosaminyltransferase